MSTLTATSPDTSHRGPPQPSPQSPSWLKEDGTLTNPPMSSTQEPSAADRLRTTMAAVRLSFTWLGVRRTLAPEQRSTAAEAFQADRQLLTASKLILDVRNPAYRKVARVRSEAAHRWRAATLPFPEPGVRLLDQNSVGLFAGTMAAYRERLHEAAHELADAYEPMKAEARQRLGTLFNEADYPETLFGLFDLEVSYPPIEPPRYLVALSPSLYRQEHARVRERFAAAVELTEQAFASELGRLMSHLAERLSGTADGRPRIFRDSAIENIREFLVHFQQLNVRSSRDLDDLVARAEATIAGLAPQDLRSSRSLRESVARDAQAIEAAVELFMTDRPRRAILRRSTGGEA